MRNLCGSEFGACKESLLFIYKTLIRSLLDYGGIAVDSASDNVLKSYDIIQTKALKICCGALHSTSVTALQNECGEEPLSLRRLQQQINYRLKVVANIQHPNYEIMQNHWTDYYGKQTTNNQSLFTKTEEFFQLHQDDFKTYLPAIQKSHQDDSTANVLNNFHVDIQLSRLVNKSQPVSILKSMTLAHLENYKGKKALQIFTDGAKDTKGHVAASFFIPELSIKKEFRLSDNSSVYTSELTAIKKSLEWILNSWNQKSHHIIILTDSLSAAKTLQTLKSKSKPKLTDQIATLINIIKNKITIVWIPGHSEISGNDVADQLAKMALQHPNIDVLVNKELSDYMQEIKIFIKDKWQDIYSIDTTAKHYKELEPMVSFKSKFSYKLSRKQEVRISRLRLGCAKVNKTLHIMKLHPDGQCNNCNQQETISHFLLECNNSDVCNTIKRECVKNKAPSTLQALLGTFTGQQILRKLINRKL